MSRTLKVTGNHVIYHRNAWFLIVIMSSSPALCCLPSVKKQKRDHFFIAMYNKTIILFGFCDIQNNQGLGKGYQPCNWLFWISQKPHPIIAYNTIVKKYMYSYTISTKMFSNLRSLCKTPIACMKAKPSVISFAQRHTSLKTAGFSDLPGTDSGPLKMWLFKFPLHFSMTKAVCEVSLSSNMP